MQSPDPPRRPPRPLDSSLPRAHSLLTPGRR
jgi:hypothetical protein